MKGKYWRRSAVVLVTLAAAVVVGCGGPSGDGNGGSSGGGGTSSLRGTISSFEMAGNRFAPVEQEGLLTRVGSWLAGALAAPAYAAGNRGGIIVSLDGPVSGTATTSDDGTFSFEGLLAGTYTLGFEYNGVAIRYRGNSGQVPTITVEEDQIVELVLRISGGKVNIGNIKVTPVDNDDPEGD